MSPASKGKGSTAAFIAAVLSANGLKTGLYCSPHVRTYKERISEAGVFFEDRVYAETASFMMTRLEEYGASESFAHNLPGGRAYKHLSFLPCCLFLFLKEQAVSGPFFETGLGGRLDATNVLTPEASVLTVIELEHTEYLGNTIAEIAGEKAGIIKPGVPVFSARQDSGGRRSIQKTRCGIRFQTVLSGGSCSFRFRISVVPVGAAV